MTDLDPRWLRSFLAVAEESNITRAAARLHLVQQAVSGHVQQLERALAVTLLVRTSRGVLLTPAGHELAAGAKAALDDLAALADRVRAVAHGQSGRLRVVCKPQSTIGFALAAVDSMERAVPGIGVELITKLVLTEEVGALTSGEADAAFLWLPLPLDGLRHAVVSVEPRMVALPRDHPLAGRAEVSLAELAGDPVVRPAVSFTEEIDRHWLAEPRPDGRPAVRGPRVGPVEERLLTVARGRGVWFCPASMSRYYSGAPVAWVPVPDAEPGSLVVAWPAGAPEELVTRFVAEVRATTGWDGPASG